VLRSIGRLLYIFVVITIVAHSAVATALVIVAVGPDLLALAYETAVLRADIQAILRTMIIDARHSNARSGAANFQTETLPAQRTLNNIFVMCVI
jgi:hypothetical protein